METEIKSIKLNGQNLKYIEIGHGYPTIVILGWLASIEKISYNKIFKKFENSFLKKNKLIFLQLSNFGSSDLSSKPFTLYEYVNEIKEFIDSMGYKKVNLVGHSAGGRHVIKFVTTYPNIVNKIVLLAAAGFTPKKPKASQLLKVNFYFHKFNSFLPHQIKILQETFSNIYQTDLRDKLSEIKSPTLIIWGKKDTTIKVGKAKIFKENIKSSQLIIFKNLGHMLTLQPAVWNKVFQFFDS